MKTKVFLSVEIETSSPIDDIQNGLKRGIYRGLDTPPHYIAPPSKVEIVFIEPQTSLFSYSTAGDYRGTLQIVAENLACANTALVHFLDEEEMGEADPPMSADDWKLTFVCPVGGDIQMIGTDRAILQGESVVLDYDWAINEE